MGDRPAARGEDDAEQVREVVVAPVVERPAAAFPLHVFSIGCDPETLNPAAHIGPPPFSTPPPRHPSTLADGVRTPLNFSPRGSMEIEMLQAGREDRREQLLRDVQVHLADRPLPEPQGLSDDGEVLRRGMLNRFAAPPDPNPLGRSSTRP
jgi:hypothetical protein